MGYKLGWTLPDVSRETSTHRPTADQTSCDSHLFSDAEITKYNI